MCSARLFHTQLGCRLSKGRTVGLPDQSLRLRSSSISRQMNMDYSLSQALKTLNGIESVILMYDVNCQYHKKLKTRFEASPYLRWPDNLKMVFGIGLFHVHGHVDSCFPQFAPHFIDGAAHVDGEIIETLWAPLNEISNSIRGMSTAHRKETLDDHMNDSNFKKMTRIGKNPWAFIADADETKPSFQSLPSFVGGTTPKKDMHKI